MVGSRGTLMSNPLPRACPVSIDLFVSTVGSGPEPGITESDHLEPGRQRVGGDLAAAQMVLLQ
jgi:hypothetical protein